MRVLTVRVVVTLALVITPGIGAVSLSTQAGAASLATCSGVAGKAQGAHLALSGCTVATTGGSGLLGADTSGTGDVVKWSNGGTTKFKFTDVPPSGAKQHCPGKTEVHLQGHVTKSTGSAVAVFGKVSAYPCLPIAGRGDVSLVRGTLWRF
jgi:hypothetical protein